VYGVPWVFYPGWVTGCVPSGPVIVFGVGIHIGWAGPCCVWRWPAWRTDWRGRTVIYNHHAYVSRTTTFIDRRTLYRAPVAPHPVPPRPRAAPAPRSVPARPAPPPSTPADWGFGPARGQTGVRSGVFSGFGQGGSTRGSAARGRTSASTPPRSAPPRGEPPRAPVPAPRRK